MNPFSYVRAADAAGAVQDAGGQAQTVYLAGGTTLLDLMKLNVMTPARVVDINGLPLDRIEALPDGGLRVGALVRNGDMAYHEAVARAYPMLSEALLMGASPQLRNMATLGGNILQRTRCPYFRDTATPCNKREPGSGCSAMEGINRTHAVLGTSAKCIATHPSDMCVPLVALDATVRLRGPQGERTVPFAEFHLLPGNHPERETVLQPGELITAVDIPALPFARRSHYLKVRDRASYAFALVSAAVALDIDGGTIRGARIALGGVGTKPWRSLQAERALVGKPMGEAAYREAAAAALSGAKPRRYNGFKIELARRCLVRALTVVGAMA
jgi:xanthine dehydrogenase YagS FAD-binding subunit